MLTLKSTGTQVRIISESKRVVIVEEVNADHFDSNGVPVFFQQCLSKKHHKGSLLLDGIAII